MVSGRFLDTALWRWIALALLVAMLSALSRLVCRIILVSTAPALHRLAPHLSLSHLDEFTGPVRLLLATIGFRAAIEWIGPSA
jgi:hypothetical protein